MTGPPEATAFGRLGSVLRELERGQELGLAGVSVELEDVLLTRFAQTDFLTEQDEVLRRARDRVVGGTEGSVLIDRPAFDEHAY